MLLKFLFRFLYRIFHFFQRRSETIFPLSRKIRIIGRLRQKNYVRQRSGAVAAADEASTRSICGFAWNAEA